MSGEPLEIVRWYTLGVKFPQVIGRTPSGGRIPGGPYTITQALGGGGFALVALQTMGWWGPFGLLGNLVVALLLSYAMVRLLGLIPIGARNPFSVATSGVSAFTAPLQGRLGGRTIRLRGPHRIKHVICQQASGRPEFPEPSPAPVSCSQAPATTPPSTAQPQPLPAPAASAAAPALSGVQALLAQPAPDRRKESS